MLRNALGLPIKNSQWRRWDSRRRGRVLLIRWQWSNCYMVNKVIMGRGCHQFLVLGLPQRNKVNHRFVIMVQKLQEGLASKRCHISCHPLTAIRKQTKVFLTSHLVILVHLRLHKPQKFFRASRGHLNMGIVIMRNFYTIKKFSRNT